MGKFGALTREFYVAEIGTWENYSGKRVWRFIGGSDITRFYCICFLIKARWPKNLRQE